MKKLTITKAKYPTKTSINLVMNEQETASPTFQIGLFAVFLVLLLVFVKFAVVDRLQEAAKAETNYSNIQSEISQLETQTADYSEVAEEYRKYSQDFLSESELIEGDRMDTMSLLDSCVLSKADAQSINISQNIVTVTIGNTSLDVVSNIVASLQADERTSFVTVSTAGTGNDKNGGQLVSADIIITLAGGAEE